MKDPSNSDYAKLYLVSGYVSADESRKSAYYFGISDKYNDNLSDIGIKTVIKGVYLMNHLNIKEDNVLSDISIIIMARILRFLYIAHYINLIHKIMDGRYFPLKLL